MHDKGKTGAATTPPPETPPKSRRGGARKLDENLRKITFTIPKAEYEVLTSIADDDDRKPEDFARLLTRAHVKKHVAAQNSASPSPGA